MQKYEFFLRHRDFFQKSADNAIVAMTSALSAMKLRGNILTLEIKHNTRAKTPEKLMILLLFHYYRCKDTSHLPHSAAGDRFSPGFNTLYSLLQNSGQELTSEQRNARKDTLHCEGTSATTKHSEYFKSKIAILLEMVLSVMRGRVDFDYLLINRRFGFDNVTKNVRSLHRNVLDVTMGISEKGLRRK